MVLGANAPQSQHRSLALCVEYEENSLIDNTSLVPGIFHRRVQAVSLTNPW